MSYCLNPDCEKALNPEGTGFCQSCGTKLVPMLRNRYRIIRPLAGGGFGRTFLAEDEDKLKEHCVVKQLAPQVQGTNALRKATELFKEEARRLQQLGEHSQIPTLYAYFEEDNFLYLVQQLIRGQTLREELKQQGIFSEEKIWELLSELLPLLQFVHQHQVIHRDIKPENIIRRQSDRKLVLIDFGVAKHLTATSLEKTGTSIGSYGYAAIEQMRHGCAYPASDLFSLGVTCFHLLTGIAPSHLWTDRGYGWATHWREYLKSPISQQLEQVLDKLLQKDIEHRYQSADEVFRDLHHQPNSPTVSQSITVAGTHLAPIAEDLSLTQPPPTISREPSNLPKPAVAATSSIKNKLLAGGVLLLLGLGGYAYWQSHRQIPTLTGHLGEVNSLALSSDGSTLASASDDKTVKIWNLNTKQKIRNLQGHSNWVYAVAMSQDGQTLISGSRDNTIKVWNLNTGKEIRTLQGHGSYVSSVSLSPDGQNIVSGSYDKTIKVWNLKTGEQLQTLKGHSREILSVAISPDGQKIASASADRTIKIWNLNTGEELHTLKGHSGDVNGVAISPDGQMLASVSDDKTIQVWNLNTGKEIRPLTGHLADVNSVAFSPDGEKIATGSDDRTIRIWNLETGEELSTLKGHLKPIFAVTFSQDGKTLISGSADNTIKIWQVL